MKQYKTTAMSRFKNMLAASKHVVGRAGVIMLALALVLQSGAFFMEQQAQAARPDDMIPGGVGSKAAILAHYDSNTNNFREVMDYNGITRAELAAMSDTKRTYQVDSVHSWGWVSRFPGRGEQGHSVAGRTIYSRPMALWGVKTYTGWEGYSAVRGKFRIQAACGNLLSWSVPQPSASCDKLVVAPVSRTKFRMTGSASGKNGASVKEIHYYIYDAASKPVNATNGGPGGSSTVTLDVQSAGTYKFQAHAVTSVGTVTSMQCTQMVTVAEEEKPAINIVKTVNGKEHADVMVGEEFTYEIVVSNTGNVDLKDAVVTDTAPKEVTLIKGSEGTVSGGKWTHTIPVLKKGESKKFTITAKYEKYAEGTHKNNVCVDTPTIPGGPDDCDDATTKTDDDMEICDLNDNQVKRIKRSEYDSSHMTEDLTKCGNMKVCIIKTKEIKTIAKKDYDESTMTTDESKCAETPVTPPTTTVTELPRTGIVDMMSGALGLGGLAAVSYAYVLSRRNLR